ncbi:sugar phosphate nucleotidyltransferase [Patescibacteria group bacterium]
MNNNVYVIILAAGKGTRMNSDLPKVLHGVCGKPILSYILKTLNKLKYNIVIVVGHKKDLVIKEFGNKYKYAIQHKRLGTGHAVLSAKKQIPQKASAVMVLNGDDSAFYKPETLQRLVEKHIHDKNMISIRSLVLRDPTGFGRIKRDENGDVVSIIEEKNASPEDQKIKEVNIGCYCFDTGYLWNNLPKLSKNKITNEYYLTDLIKYAVQHNQKINAYPLKDSQEWFGVNTPEQLRIANKQMQKCLNFKKSQQ